MANIEKTVQFVKEIKAYLDSRLTGAKRWENTFTCKQYEKRKTGKSFTINEHIQAMVYSMLTDGIPWSRLDEYTDLKTGSFPEIDYIFCEYNPEKILSCSSEDLKSKIKSLGISGQVDRLKQMYALKENIEIVLLHLAKLC